MKYVTIGGVEQVLYGYRKSEYGQRYIAPKLQDYRERLPPQYGRISSLRTIASSYLASGAASELQRQKPRRICGPDCYISLIAGQGVSATGRNRKVADEWVRFFYQPVIIYSNNHNAMERKEPQKARYELVELKNEGCDYEFFIRNTTTKRFVEWKDLPDVDGMREYLRICPFPRDKCFSREKFLNELENEEGYILLRVEKRETAEFICELCDELI